MINFLTLKILQFFDFFNQKKFINFLKSKNHNQLNIMIDVGAHKGESIYLFAKNFNIDKIFSFEANPETFKTLNIQSSGIKKKFNKTKIIFENFALGSENKTIKIKDVIESSSSTIRNLNPNSQYFKRKFFFLNRKKKLDIFRELSVKQILLSDYIRSKNIRKIDLIKIDTEGYEFDVLKGSRDILNITKYIFFEHHYDDMIIKNYSFSDIHHFLKNHNFVKIYKSKMPFRKTFEYLYINESF